MSKLERRANFTPQKLTVPKVTRTRQRTPMSPHREQTEEATIDSAKFVGEKPIESDVPTVVSSRGCDHRDLAGDSLIEVSGPYHRCTSCGATWTDKELVIVNDEPRVA
jgi:hypothetical protein